MKPVLAALTMAGLIVLLPLAARADVYKAVDAQGRIYFTDVPQDERAELIIRETPLPKPAQKAVIYPPGSWKAYAKQMADEKEIDPLLVGAVIQAESAGNPEALSPKGAMGLMQLMPGTARELGVDDPFQPHENVRGGVTYLAQLLRKFEGNLRLALAAYNAGPAAVQKYGGVPPYEETQAFVERVLKIYRDSKYLADRT